MENPVRTNAVDVLHFINAGSSRQCTMTPEFSAFWKSCTEDEKKQFGAEARSMSHPEIHQG